MAYTDTADIVIGYPTSTWYSIVTVLARTLAVMFVPGQ